MSDATLTVEQAAAYLHVHEDTLRELARARIIPASKPGKRWVFRQAALDEYLIQLEAKACRSTDARTLPIGGASSTSEASRYEDRLNALIAAKRKRPKLTCVKDSKTGRRE